MWWRDERAGGGTGPDDPVVLRWEPGWSRTSLIEGVWHRHRASTCWKWWEAGTVQGRLWCRCGAEWTGRRWRSARTCARGGLRAAARNEVLSR